jgi:hypothetical protein
MSGPGALSFREQNETSAKGQGANIPVVSEGPDAKKPVSIDWNQN